MHHLSPPVPTCPYLSPISITSTQTCLPSSPLSFTYPFPIPTSPTLLLPQAPQHGSQDLLRRLPPHYHLTVPHHPLLNSPLPNRVSIISGCIPTHIDFHTPNLKYTSNIFVT
ncbi:hypothetical protein L211DRAFT_834354 [Terfezia boudieri ATCC MYA-4762]|uniref:Uncharacterized protein n=1 Tax=Terfezia boudieri ATCC MYA-4762 TaxID=1051890 RepID=A0A3N4LX76_9PEZI|nr:hypothetical protein L211DRAFT_834354 [Terfezia boudieri ATCC MYA-4762]